MGNAEQKGHVTVTEEGEHVIITEAADRDGIWAVDRGGSGDGDVGVQVDAYVDADVDDADVDAFSEDMHVLWDVLAIDDAAQRAARMAELGYEVYIEDGLEGYRKAAVVEDTTNGTFPAPPPGNALEGRLAEEAAERRQLEQRLESAQRAVGALLTGASGAAETGNAKAGAAEGRAGGGVEGEGRGGMEEAREAGAVGEPAVAGGVGGAEGMMGVGGTRGAEGGGMRESELMREVGELRRENEALKQLLLLAFQRQGAADLPQMLPQLQAQSRIPAESAAQKAETALAATMCTDSTTDASTAATGSSTDASTGPD
ncbi:unnamed protein product [Closterium sp. Yama58-4]|nr:unnamed protein product [Closterium sp. Yama58-4]